jgi:dTDP-4-dehydrorhamnose reductase
MKILILGGSGVVGETFLEKSKEHELLATYDKNKIVQKDVTTFQIHLSDDLAKLKELIVNEKPEIIINFMAYSNADFCEENKIKTYDLHVNTTKIIATICSEMNIKLIFLSSDYVFDGKKSNYQEHNLPNPINYYGITKYEAERCVLTNPNNLVIRTSLIYGSSTKVRFLKFVLDNLLKEQEIFAYDDIFNNATLVDELSDAILKSMDLNISGILHIVGSSCVSRFEFANIIAKIFNYNNNLIKPTSVISANLKANRPVKPCLDNSKASKILKMKFSTIEEGVQLVYQQLNNK